MKKTEKVFVSGNILKAYELNDLIAKLNELVGCVNDNDLETAKKTIDGLKKSILEISVNPGTLGELTNVDAAADSVSNGLYNLKKEGDVFALVKALILGDKRGTAYDGASGKSLEDKINAIIDGGNEGEVVVSVSLKELREAIEILRSDVSEKLSVSLEDGFHFVDSTGYDVMNYTSEGFDAAKVSGHFIALVLTVGSIAPDMLSDELKKAVYDNPKVSAAIERLTNLQENFSQVDEDGFHFVDSTGYDVMNYTSEGFDAAKVSGHFIATLNAAGISGSITYEFKNNKEYQ